MVFGVKLKTGPFVRYWLMFKYKLLLFLNFHLALEKIKIRANARAQIRFNIRALI